MVGPTDCRKFRSVNESTASARETVLSVERERVPVRPETRACCDAVGVDPLATFGSGALLAAVPPERVDEATDALDAAGIDSGVIGEVRAPDAGGDADDGGSGGHEGGAGSVLLDGERIEEPPRDELYPFWERE